MQEFNFPSFVLTYDDVTDYEKDFTENEMKTIVALMEDYLMEYAWREALEDAITVVRGDRKTASLRN